MSSYVADVMSVDVFHAVTFYSQPGYLPPQQCNGGQTGLKYLQLGAAGCAMVVAGGPCATLLFVTQSWSSPENMVEDEV